MLLKGQKASSRRKPFYKSCLFWLSLLAIAGLLLIACVVLPVYWMSVFTSATNREPDFTPDTVFGSTAPVTYSPA